MTKLLDVVDAVLEPPEPWIVVWITYDRTHRPFWCGMAEDGHVWSRSPEDAFRFASREAAERFEELSDFFEGEDVEAVSS